MRNLAPFALALLALAAAPAGNSSGAEVGPSWRGLWASTPYPAETVAPGNPVTLDVEIHNAGLPPQIVALSMPDVAKGWTAEILGGGRPVKSTFVGPDDRARVTLRLTPPEDATAGGYDFLLAAKAPDGRFDLPIRIDIGDVTPAKLAISAELPALRGTARSNFEYKLTINNPGTDDVTAQLRADAPPGFQTTFKERYGSQELTSVPIKAGGKRDLSVKIEPPDRTDAGTYQVAVHAITPDDNTTTTLTMDITGQPELKLTGLDGRLSGNAQIGEQNDFDLVLANHGSAPARDIKLSASQPNGWKVVFEPARLDSLPPGTEEKVKAVVTPATQAIAGDYQMTLRAGGSGVSDSANFRVTARTSTIWGIAGILIIAASLGVLVLAVARYGRR